MMATKKKTGKKTGGIATVMKKCPRCDFRTKSSSKFAKHLWAKHKKWMQSRRKG